ncbi:hypothetical protein [Butyricimonas faecihominis]
MKRIILLLVIISIASSLPAQKYDNGIVRGKNVTYRVRENRLLEKIICNVDNPDTTLKRIPVRFIYGIPQIIDIKMQVAGIVHDHLSKEELASLKDDTDDDFCVVLRVDRDKHQILQVVCFYFENHYAKCHFHHIPTNQKAYEGFWLNFPPDRLHVIEKSIIKKIKLPKYMPETYLKDDFIIIVKARDIRDQENAIKQRVKAMNDWIYWQCPDIPLNGYEQIIYSWKEECTETEKKQ